MSLSILGAGQVGMALGRAFTQRGEPVFFGVPDPVRYEGAVAALGPLARVGTVGEAVEAADTVILAVPYAALPAIAQARADWGGRVLVDATNPLAPGLAGLALGTTTSGAETLAGLASGARVVKAFHSTGAENLADARYLGGAPFMPVCGDDADARRHVLALATRIGFEAVDLGPLKAARWLEPFAMTWIHMAIRQGLGRRFAFGLLRRE